MKKWLLLLTLFAGSMSVAADASSGARAEMAAALKGMGDAANAHDVERHVGYYAHTPDVTLIFDGEALVGWDTILDKQKEGWNNGKTDVVYELRGPPEIVQLAPTVMVTTLLMKARRTLSSGEVKESGFAVSSVWQKWPEGDGESARPRADRIGDVESGMVRRRGEALCLSGDIHQPCL